MKTATTTMATSSLKRKRGGFEWRIDMPPVPCPRPRFSKWGTYYPPRYQKWRAEFERTIEATDLPPCTPSPVEVWIEFVCVRPAKPANRYPIGDIDNYIKSVLDGTQGKAFFTDDKQVESIRATKRFALKGETPHISVWVGLSNPTSEDVLDQPDTISIEELE
jgi:Holliday junction resolvase RusA-like endonuclease